MFDEASEDQLLSHSLASLGARAGGAAGARGTVRGAKATKKVVSTAVEEIAGTAKSTCEKVRELLVELGSLVGEEAHGDGSFTIRAVMGSGFAGLNPTIVTAQVTSDSDATTQLSLRAAAREGLIKQRSADKALTKIIQRLRVDEDTASRRTD